MGLISRQAATIPHLCCAKRPGTRIIGNTKSFTHAAIPAKEHIIILGGGIAGLSTARYLLLHNAQQKKQVTVTLIDENDDIIPTKSTSYSTYEEQICSYMHRTIASRRNGNVICPSLTVPWTTRNLWKEAILPGMKSLISTNKESSPSITFDWHSLVRDKNMVRGTC